MNMHNMTQKNLFEAYMAPSSIAMSRCYSSKANVNSFTPTAQCLGKNSLFSMKEYLNNGGHFNKKNNGFCAHGSLRIPNLMSKNESNDSFGPDQLIIGGFVGSKSQAGSSNHRGRDFSLWDVIFDKIVEVIDHSENKQTHPNISKRMCEVNSRKPSQKFGFAMLQVGGFDQKFCTDVVDDHNKMWQTPESLNQPGGNPGCPVQQTIHSKYSSHGSDGFESSPKLIYDSPCTPPNADRNLSCLGLGPTSESTNASIPSHNFGDILTPTPSVNNSIISESTDNIASDEVCEPTVNPEETSSLRVVLSLSDLSASEDSDDESSPSDVLSSSCDSHSNDTYFTRRKAQRTISECSAESDDSFIVFESADDDPLISEISDDDDDDEDLSDDDLDEIDHCILVPHNCDVYPQLHVLTRLEEVNEKWNRHYSNVKPKADTAKKKVNFVKGNDMVKIKRLVTWDFAHRAARVGPWEMYRRDSERFKARISNLSSVISPILDATHRKNVFAQRFQI